jgi:hypothetical protein
VWWAAAAAAVLVVAIVVPVVWEDLGLGGADGEGEVLPETAELAAALAPSGPARSADASGLLAGGFAFAGGAGPREAALWAGVRLMDLAGAARGLELDGADEALEGLARLLADAGLDRALEDDLDAAREALAEADAQALAEADALALQHAVTRLEAGAEDALDPFYLTLGKWAEAGRLAAASGDVAFFRASAFAGFLATLGERELSKPAAEAVGRIEKLTRQTLGPEELDELKAALGGLILGPV